MLASVFSEVWFPTHRRKQEARHTTWSGGWVGKGRAPVEVGREERRGGGRGRGCEAEEGSEGRGGGYKVWARGEEGGREQREGGKEGGRLTGSVTHGDVLAHLIDLLHPLHLVLQ